jgi:hypothetical protein
VTNSLKAIKKTSFLADRGQLIQKDKNIMQSIEQHFEQHCESASLQTEYCKNWLKKRFISELEIEEMPIEWAAAWATAVTELGFELTESLIERLLKGDSE